MITNIKLAICVIVVILLFTVAACMLLHFFPMVGSIIMLSIVLLSVMAGVVTSFKP